MDLVAQNADDLKLLRDLCDERRSHKRRLEILQSYDRHVFIDPERQVVFESIRLLLPTGNISAALLAVHLNNRGFPDMAIDSYFLATPVDSTPHEDIKQKKSARGFSATAAAVILGLIALVLIFIFLGRPLRRLVRESLMQRVTSTHYEILCPPGAMSQETMTEFASQRESLFNVLDGKLGDTDSNAEIQIIFDTDSPHVVTASTEQPYAVSGTTIRTKLDGRTPELDSAADAEALLQTAWGKRGNARTGRWTSLWLVGTWDRQELGVAAAEVEQRLGHQKVAMLLGDVANKIYSPHDRDVLGAAWVSEIAELNGIADVRKLYSTKSSIVTMGAVTTALGTTPQELERKWQLWMYSYLAGMGPTSHNSAMPMDMR